MSRKNIWLAGLAVLVLGGGIALLNPFGSDVAQESDSSSGRWSDDEESGPVGSLAADGANQAGMERTAVTGGDEAAAADEEEEEPRPAITVSGRVLSAGGGGVAGARVAVHYRMSFDAMRARDFGPGGPGGPGGARNLFRTRSAGPAVRTDDQGQFTLTGRAYAASSLEIQVVHPDFAPAIVQRDWQRKDGALALGDIVVETGAVVSGFVVDANGSAVAQAEVGFQTNGGPGGGPFGGRGGRGFRGGRGGNGDDLPTLESLVGGAKTDASGHFRIEHVPAGRFRLEARASHFLPAVTETLEAKASVTVDAGEIKMTPGVELRGLVVDTTGAPIADARVDASPSFQRNGPDQNGGDQPDWRAMANLWRTGGADRRTRTNKNGEFVFDSLPPGSLRLQVEHPRFVSEEQEPIDPKETPKVVMRMTPALTLVGRVVDESGKPVTVYAVAARENNNWGGPGGNNGRGNRGRRGGDPAQTQGPGGGRRRGGGDPNGATTPGNEAADAQRAADEARRAQRTAYVQQRLGPSGQVPRNPGKPSSHPDGRFELTGLQPGQYLIDVVAEDFVGVAAGPLELTKGQNPADLTISLRRGSKIIGRVEDKLAHTPLANVQVDLLLPDTDTPPTENEAAPWAMMRREASRVRVARTRTDAEGRFTMRPQSSGEYWLEIEHDGYNGLLDRSVFVPDGRTLETPPYALVPGSEVFGQVLNPAPEASYSLTFLSTTGQRYTARPDKDSRYRVEGIEAGSYFVVLNDGSDAGGNRGGRRGPGGPGPMGLGTRILDFARGNAKPDVVVAEGARVQFDVDALAQAQAKVHGKILLNGSPAAGLDVSLSDNSAATTAPTPGGNGRGNFGGRMMGRLLSGRTNDEGEFDITGVPAGSYTLEIRRGGGGGRGGRGGRGGFGGGGPTLHREPLVVAQGARIDRTFTFATGRLNFEVSQEADGKPLDRANIALVLRAEVGATPPDEWRSLPSFTNVQVRNGTAAIQDLKLGEWMYRLTQAGPGRGNRGQNGSNPTGNGTPQPTAAVAPVEGVAFVDASAEPTPVRIKVKAATPK